MQHDVIARGLARFPGVFPILLLLGALPTAYAATPAIAVQRYTLDITLDPASQSFMGSVSMEFIRSSDAVGPIRVDMADALTAESAVLDGKPVGFTHASDTLAIQVTSLAPGAHALIIRYHGHSQGGHHDLQFVTGEDGPTVTNFGMPYTAKNWWPDFDDPATKARSMDIRFTLPKELTAASNGSLQGVTDLPGGLHQYHWVESYPIYPDVVSIAAGRYQKLDSTFASVTGRTVPIEYYVFNSDLALAKSEFALVPSVLKVYESLFGAYPFEKEKYGIAEVSVPSFREHQTLPMLGKALMTGSKPVWDLGNVSNVIAHDMAHQWFGNSLTPESWSDVWLNEGFATYAVALWRERAQGEQAYRDFMGFLDSHDFSGSIRIKDEHDMDSQFTSTTFNKGAWVLHMLRHVMGDADFFSALKNYATDNRYGQVDTAKWRVACERVYGQPLGWFFDEWIDGEGQPALKSSWSESGGKLKLQVTQTQKDQAFVMPLDVEIVTDAGKSRQTVWLRSRDQSAELPVPGKVRSVVLDPDDWLLKS